MQPNRKDLPQWDRHEETLRQNPRRADRLFCDAHQTSVPVARDSLANEGLIVRKPNSGSARHRWARENSKHPRTATRQRGFCSSSLEQLPLDFIKPGMTPENRSFEIVRKAAPLRTPAQSTELKEFRGYGGICQSERLGLQPPKGGRGRELRLFSAGNSEVPLWN